MSSENCEVNKEQEVHHALWHRQLGQLTLGCWNESVPCQEMNRLENIQNKLKVALIQDEIRESQLKYVGHLQLRPRIYHQKGVIWS